MEQPDQAKALTVPATATTFTPQQVAELLASTTVGGQTTGAIVPLPRLEPQVAFGPGMPLIPGAIDPLDPRTGRPQPRFNDYPVSSNLPGVEDRLVPWKVLRDAADVGGLARRCIEIRKTEVVGLEWAITITKSAVEAARAADPDRAPSEVEAELRERLTPEIARCTKFWRRPDPGQDESTADWMGKLLEEHLVLDAVAIYPRRTWGGDLFALEILDGTTVKLLRDHRGGRPMPPNPAYQQILQGFPRGEFVADTDADGKIADGYRSDELIYKRRNIRAHTPYGYSAVEQALEDIDVWLRRRKWIRDEYTEGTVPTGLLRNSGASGWSPAQTSEYETLLNDAYSSTGSRHRLRVLPPGMELETQADAAERYKPEYDLFLIKLIASHFDVTIAELGFTEEGGLGSSGWHEGQADVQERKGTFPTVRWLQQLVTVISRQHLGMPDELEFRFLGLEEEGEATADEVAKSRVADGRMTYNEDRDRMGLPRYDFPEADMPLIRTTRGLVFLNGASDLVPAGEIVGAVQGRPLADRDADGILDAPQGPDNDTKIPTADDEDKEGGAETDEDDGEDRTLQVKAELSAYRRWARRNPAPVRPFTFTVVTKADAPDLADTAVVFAAAPDRHPKAEARPPGRAGNATRPPQTSGPGNSSRN
ncbi:phage portal protein [Kitasatospora sp. NBC_00240]|uniref:phage portal protein n=1 Tax=Kitasatospora sp. NBC_00240 TaxID=2903567 RepID=UPI002252D0DE|nr:phage portal protein [Kitasatospora sp. NBC_00240]MCX5209808.1 phage portal protein [Kitasatospora sp. NBC_00240]